MRSCGLSLSYPPLARAPDSRQRQRLLCHESSCPWRLPAAAAEEGGGPAHHLRLPDLSWLSPASETQVPRAASIAMGAARTLLSQKAPTPQQSPLCSIPWDPLPLTVLGPIPLTLLALDPYSKVLSSQGGWWRALLHPGGQTPP